MLMYESKNSHFDVNRIPSLRQRSCSDMGTIQMTSSVQCMRLAKNVIGIKGRSHFYCQGSYADLKHTQEDKNQFFPLFRHQFLNIYKFMGLGES